MRSGTGVSILTATTNGNPVSPLHLRRILSAVDSVAGLIVDLIVIIGLDPLLSCAGESPVELNPPLRDLLLHYWPINWSEHVPAPRLRRPASRCPSLRSASFGDFVFSSLLDFLPFLNFIRLVQLITLSPSRWLEFHFLSQGPFRSPSFP